MKVTKVQTWKMVVANLLAVLMVVMSVAVIAPTAAYAASKPALTKTTLKITEGKKYGLKIKNKIAKSSYKWSTSNKKVAKVDKKGVVKAVKKGNATITCKVKAGKKAYALKCKVTVVKAAKKPAKKVVDNKGNDGSVTNQTQLDAALTGSVSAITIKTTDAVNLTIKAGDYSSKTLVVDAPNADITNEGKFASIEIKQIKSSTWNENTTGNTIKVFAPNARIIVGDKASVSIEVANEGTKLALVNNGEVKKVTVAKKADVEISGTSATVIPVIAQVAGVKLTTSIPLKLVCEAKIELVINKGAEDTKIQVPSLDLLPTVIGTGYVTVTVGTGDTAQSVLVQAISAGTTTTTTSGGSGGVIGGGTSSSTLTFDAALSKLTAVSVNYGNNKTFALSDENFSLIKLALSSDAAAATWAALPSKTYSVNGKKVTLSGNVGDTTKNVTVGGSTYAVTAVNNNTFKLTNANGVSITIDKSADDKAFQLKTSTTLQDVATSKTADKALTKLDVVNSVNATYNGNNYTVECPELAKIAKYVNNEALFYTLWPTIDTKVIDKDITITGTKGSNTKTVTVDGIAFTTTVNADQSVTVTNSSKVNATIVKGSNNIVVTLN